MNLYLLTQDESYGYDTYDSCIVAAENEEQARTIRPGYSEWDIDYSYYDWATSPKNVEAKLIGTSDLYSEPKVILASYRAG